MHRINNQGFSLIEVLVSLAILSVGLLGLAMLQSKTSVYTASSHWRSIAIAQVNDITDRMRANMTGVNDGNYNNITGSATKPTCTNCTAAQIATMDHAEWASQNQALLPLGQGTVTRVGNSFRIRVMWSGGKEGGLGTNCSGNLTVDLACFTVTMEL